MAGDTSSTTAASPSPFSRARASHAEKRWPRLASAAKSVRQLEESIQQVAGFDCSVLITGETGCGKEEVARAIHASGPRSTKPFVALNCSGLVADLAESQLFGHERGSFTGAMGSTQGVFRAANGGVVFLDEIGELPLELQPKLLRVLQLWEVTPVGSTDVHRVDVQVIAATNRDLESRVETGAFREDLFYRLNTIHLAVPPLRERREDIPRFIEHFSSHYAREYDRPLWVPEPPLIARLVNHPWPGNVRQLAQMVQRVYVLEDRRTELLDALLVAPQSPASTPLQSASAGTADAPAGSPPTEDVPTDEPAVPVYNLVELRRLAVRQAMVATGGHRSQAAELLGVSLNTMTRLVAECCPEHAASRAGRKRSVTTAKPR